MSLQIGKNATTINGEHGGICRAMASLGNNIAQDISQLKGEASP